MTKSYQVSASDIDTTFAACAKMVQGGDKTIRVVKRDVATVAVVSAERARILDVLENEYPDLLGLLSRKAEQRPLVPEASPVLVPRRKLKGAKRVLPDGKVQL